MRRLFKEGNRETETEMETERRQRWKPTHIQRERGGERD